MYGQYKSANLGGCKENIRAVINKQIMAKMKIIDYGFVGDDRTSVRIYTEGGGMITAKRCPTEKPLYCTRDGHFLSLTKLGLREVKPCFAVPRDPRVCHTRYPFMRQFGNRTCHMLMALTWIGPRPEGYEVDHLNGDMLNWSADNLEYVTPEENRKRARLLRVLRSIGRDPKQMSREELLGIFRKYEFRNSILSPEGHDYFRD